MEPVEDMRKVVEAAVEYRRRYLKFGAKASMIDLVKALAAMEASNAE